MTLTIESNIREVIVNIKRRAQALAHERTISVVNNAEHAVAVEVGHTRTIIWDELSQKQRAAIILSMKNRQGKPRKWDGDKEFVVDRFEGGVTVTVPPEGMLAKSQAPIKAFGGQVLKRLPNGFTNRDLDMAAAEIGAGALSILADNTPVDQGTLIRSWEVRT
jgi:hypothetical protein